MNSKVEINTEKIEIESLIKIAIFLEGIKQGKGGNILPLGNNDLEQLWKAISILENDKINCY